MSRVVVLGCHEIQIGENLGGLESLATSLALQPVPDDAAAGRKQQ